MTDAVSGISRLRNAAASSRNASATTTPMKSGSLPAIDGGEVGEDRGQAADVDRAPGAAFGMTSLRRWCSSEVVLAACGLVVGKTVMIPALPVGAMRGGRTDATPGVARMAAASFSSAGRSAALLVAAATVKGPLKPGPKPSASRS